MKLPLLDYETILENYQEFQQATLKGRYLKEEDVLNVFKTLSHKFKIKNQGYSEEGRIISSFHLGNGPKRILIWSQMHGNESTTTKSILDVMNFFSSHTEFSDALFKICRFIIIPVLNPDGASRYTRVNANGVDLNRDASAQTQAESKVLQNVYREFQPDVCFNLHDQRTIFSAGKTTHPATVSFLSPSFNENRDLNETRVNSMSLISSANHLLQKFIPGQVGRYDDGFNINCIGDYFQKKGTPTVLFEAGHFPKDYDREETRKLISLALLKMIEDFANEERLHSTDEYFNIPENEKLFYDIILKNVKLESNSSANVAIQYKEVLKENRIEFIPYIDKITDENTYFGHREIDVNHQFLELEPSEKLREGSILSKIKVDDNVFVI